MLRVVIDGCAAEARGDEGVGSEGVSMAESGWDMGWNRA